MKARFAALRSPGDVGRLGPSGVVGKASSSVGKAELCRMSAITSASVRGSAGGVVGVAAESPMPQSACASALVAVGSMLSAAVPVSSCTGLVGAGASVEVMVSRVALLCGRSGSQSSMPLCLLVNAWYSLDVAYALLSLSSYAAVTRLRVSWASLDAPRCCLTKSGSHVSGRIPSGSQNPSAHSGMVEA